MAGDSYNIDIGFNAAAVRSGVTEVTEGLGRVERSHKNVESASKQLADRFRELRERIDPAIAASRELAEGTTLLFQAQRAGITTMQEVARLMELQGAQLQANIAPFEATITNLETETKLLRMDAAEREVQTRLLQLENQLRGQGVLVTSEQTAAMVEQLRVQQAIKAEQAAAGGHGVLGIGKEFLKFAGGFEVFRLMEGLGELNNRIRVVTESDEEFKRVQEELYQVAQHTRTAWVETAETYQRVYSATRELGLSEQQVVDFTREMNTAFKVAGVSMGEQTRVTRDLLHGLDQGHLTWRQLNPIMAQTPTIARMIAEHFHVTTGELKALASQGKITAEDLVETFREHDAKLEQQLGKTAPTLKQAWETFENAGMHALQTLAPLIEGLAQLLSGLGDAIDFATKHWREIGLALVPFTGGLSALPSILEMVSNGISYMDEHVNVTGQSFLGMARGAAQAGAAAEALKASLDRANASMDRALASLRAVNMLGMLGVETGAIRATMAVNDLVKTINKTREAGNKVIIEAFTGTGAFKGADDALKVFNRQTIDDVHRFTRENKQAATEIKQLTEQLHLLEKAASPLAKAEVELAKAEELVHKAAAKGIEINAAVIAGLDERRRKVQELRIEEERSSVAAVIHRAQLASETDALVTDATKAKDAVELVFADLPQKESEWVQGIEEFRRRFLDTSHDVKETFMSAFGSMNNLLIDFLNTGEFKWQEFTQSILVDLERLLLKRAELALFNTILNALTPSSGIGNGLMNPFTEAVGYASGGAFTVGGSGGTDSRLVAFRATPGERVTVSTPGDRGPNAAGAVVVPAPVVNVNNRVGSVGDYLRTSSGHNDVINVLRQNEGTVRRIFKLA